MHVIHSFLFAGCTSSRCFYCGMNRDRPWLHGFTKRESFGQGLFFLVDICRRPATNSHEGYIIRKYCYLQQPCSRTTYHIEWRKGKACCLRCGEVFSSENEVTLQTSGQQWLENYLRKQNCRHMSELSGLEIKKVNRCCVIVRVDSSRQCILGRDYSLAVICFVSLLSKSSKH